MKTSKTPIIEREHEQCVCPICGKMNLDYCSSESDGTEIRYPWICPDCGATGEECYSMVFLGHKAVTSNNDEED